MNYNHLNCIPFKPLCWAIVALQYCVSFCCRVKWTSCMCTAAPPTPLGHHTARSWTPRAVLQAPPICFTHGSTRMSMPAPSSAHLPLPLACPHIRSLHLCLYSFPANRFIRFCIHVLICDVFLWLTSLCKTSSRLIHITSADSVSLEWIEEANLILDTMKLLD